MAGVKASSSVLRDVALVLLAVVAVAAAAYVLTRNPQEPVARVAPPVTSASPAPSEEPSRAVDALLVGGPEDGALADALEDQLGWEVSASLVAGSGFIVGSGQSYVTRVPALLSAGEPDVVVLSAGTAEGEGVDLRRYGANVSFVLNAVREALPQARIILVGPVGADGFGGTRGQLTGVAARWGAFLVDPIGRRYVAADPALLEPDGSLGLRGRQAVARQIADELERVLPSNLVAS